MPYEPSSIPPSKSLLINTETMGSLALDAEATRYIVLGLLALAHEYKSDPGRAQQANDLAAKIHKHLTMMPLIRIVRCFAELKLVVYGDIE